MMKKMMIVSVVLCFAGASMFMMASCAKKQVMVEEKAAPKVTPAPEKAPGMGEGKAEEERQARLRELEAAQKLRAEIAAFESQSIYFDFDKSELKPPARAILDNKASWLRENGRYKVRIEGHCDERGTNEYNLALGERRANAAFKYLNALGISTDRMTTISYGEERPVCTEHNEACWSKNRRDEFKLYK
ncbi:MAG: peptidoglycan-associated lipoprotein Pal [Deltaproteobacteria bacterium]|jgi:peptidoglycan-associated lipoprotein